MGRIQGDSEHDSLALALIKDVGFCLLVAVILMMINMPMSGFDARLALQWLIASFAISLGIGMTISNLYRFAMPPIVSRWPGRWTSIACHVLFAFFSVAFGGELALRVLQLIGFRTSEMRTGVFQIGLVVVIVITAITVGYEKLRERARTTEMRAQEAQQRALRAELQALQARTDPHFLFNTLNTVAGLVEEDPVAAERMLERLSSVFRYALEGSRNRWVRLEEEWEAIGDYLEVERIRFGDRLRVRLEIDDAVRKSLVPPLILQPLVENAVLHGIAGQLEGGTIRVVASRASDALILSVEDSGPGPGHSRHSGSGQGVANLRERLQLIYGERAGLTIEAPASGGCRATLSLPTNASESDD